MASHGSILILVLPVAIVPMFSLAKEYIVGDETGWTIAFDYQAWAQGKDFRGGDKLATPGKKWYICGVGKHCEVGGQKLTITVQSEAPAPSPSMVPSPLGGMPARKRLFINFLMWG
ncbi:hypothetical protein RCOM_1494350 [Ricinus communis]|uniref:Phytocyanin domain-containing protein n=1 Tax=Ricinus communis TaxID=3988 RepID=B9RQM2_RICCO|nr:hypothetical protein RCOM_1494350 [Ricinus communis]